ncbi:MAG: hypothetical protein AAFV19_09575 [Pseudomonadota bacterium]
MLSIFIGVPLPRDVVSVLEKAQGGLTVGYKVPPAALHVPVVDLGEHIGPVIDRLKTELGRVRAAPFYLQIDGLNTEGGSAPSAIYAEVDQPRGLKTMRGAITEAVRDADVPVPYEKYTPMVVLAEFDEMGTHDLKQIMSFLSRRQGLSAGPFPVTAFCLYTWRIEANQPVLEIIETFELTG